MFMLELMVLLLSRSINQSINQSIIYYLFSKEKTIINKYNEINLNKTNKTLRNNLAYYLIWEKCLQKAKKSYDQALCGPGGLSGHPRKRTLQQYFTGRGC